MPAATEGVGIEPAELASASVDAALTTAENIPRSPIEQSLPAVGRLCVLPAHDGAGVDSERGAF
eukprot:780460-Pleurochrysis_carterae.AAC.1